MPSIPSKPDCRISVSCPSFPEALIVINFACMIPLDIVIHLLPIDTALSDRNFVLSIPSKHNLQISLCCQSISVPPILVNVVFALVCPEFSEPHYLKQFSCNTNFLVLFVFSGLISFFVSENQCTHEMCLTPIDACRQHRASNSTPAAATALHVDLHAAARRFDLHASGPAAVGCSTAHQGV